MYLRCDLVVAVLLHEPLQLLLVGFIQVVLVPGGNKGVSDDPGRQLEAGPQRICTMYCNC